jgi:hypothetical protein
MSRRAGKTSRRGRLWKQERAGRLWFGWRVTATTPECTCTTGAARLVIYPRGTGHGGSVTAVFLVQAMDALQEALLLAQELRALRRVDIRVAALVEDGSLNMSAFKAQRAVNRIDAVSFYRNDERAAVSKIARTAVPSLAVAA